MQHGDINDSTILIIHIWSVIFYTADFFTMTQKIKNKFSVFMRIDESLYADIAWFLQRLLLNFLCKEKCLNCFVSCTCLTFCLTNIMCVLFHIHIFTIFEVFFSHKSDHLLMVYRISQLWICLLLWLPNVFCYFQEASPTWYRCFTLGLNSAREKSINLPQGLFVTSWHLEWMDSKTI